MPRQRSRAPGPTDPPFWKGTDVVHINHADVLGCGAFNADMPDRDRGLAELLDTLADDPAKREISIVAMQAASIGFDLADEAAFNIVVATGRRWHEAGEEMRVLLFPTRTAEPRTAQVQPERGHAPIVYYMRLGDIVKIGTTTNVAKRAGSINPEGVMAVEFGAVDVERARHNQFIDLHLHGEWFRLDATLGSHVIEVRAAFEAATGETTEAWLARMRTPGAERGKRRKPVRS